MVLRRRVWRVGWDHFRVISAWIRSGSLNYFTYFKKTRQTNLSFDQKIIKSPSQSSRRCEVCSRFGLNVDVGHRVVKTLWPRSFTHVCRFYSSHKILFLKNFKIHVNTESTPVQLTLIKSDMVCGKLSQLRYFRPHNKALARILCWCCPNSVAKFFWTQVTLYNIFTTYIKTKYKFWERLRQGS